MDIAKWALRFRWIAFSVPKAVAFADEILAGRAQSVYLYPEEKAAGDSICTITEIVYVDPDAAYRTEQAGYFALRDRGAAGDAEAAIAYCKLEVQGLPNHSAMG
jgi:hypothetical protein